MLVGVVAPARPTGRLPLGDTSARMTAIRRNEV
jgi:hypothetical protein